MSNRLQVRESAPTKDWVPTEVHDWESKETNVLVLNYTMACALACDFCCYGCHPGRSEKMPIAQAIRLVEQAAELGVFSSVGFTGGEPMLFYEELLVIGNTLSRLGLPFTIATACHWADSLEHAEKVIDALVQRGLCRLNVSHDPSHAKFVPASSVINAVRAASELGIPTYVVGTFHSPFEKLADFVPELVDLPKVTLVEKYVSKVGRASKKDITQDTYGINLGLEDLCCYRRIYHDIVVFYDGKTYPCCSTFNRSTNGIILGNAFKTPLRELWERAEGSLMIRVIKRQGFAQLYKIIKQLDSDLYESLPRVDDTVGPCSLCNRILGSREIAPRVQRVFEEYEKNKVSNVLDVLTSMLGKDKAAAIGQEALSIKANQNRNKEESYATNN